MRDNLLSDGYQGRMCLTLSISPVIPNTRALITGEILYDHASLLDNDIVGPRITVKSEEKQVLAGFVKEQTEYGFPVTENLYETLLTVKKEKRTWFSCD